MGNIIKKALLDSIGKKPDYQIIQEATNWVQKKVLTEDDLEEIKHQIQINEKGA